MEDEDELIILNLFFGEESGSNYFIEDSVEARALDEYLRVCTGRRSFRLVSEEGSISVSLLPVHGHRIKYRNLDAEQENRAQAMVDAALRSGVIEVRGH